MLCSLCFPLNWKLYLNYSSSSIVLRNLRMWYFLGLIQMTFVNGRLDSSTHYGQWPWKLSFLWMCLTFFLKNDLDNKTRMNQKKLSVECFVWFEWGSVQLIERFVVICIFFLQPPNLIIAYGGLSIYLCHFLFCVKKSLCVEVFQEWHCLLSWSHDKNGNLVTVGCYLHFIRGIPEGRSRRK